MKVIKKALSVLLLLSVVLSLSACSATRLKQDSVVKALENQDFEECDDYNEFSAIYGRMNKENAAYVKLTDKKAQKAYDKLFNRLNKYPSADVTDATCAFFSGKTDSVMCSSSNSRMKTKPRKSIRNSLSHLMMLMTVKRRA